MESLKKLSYSSSLNYWIELVNFEECKHAKVDMSSDMCKNFDTMNVTSLNFYYCSYVQLDLCM